MEAEALQRYRLFRRLGLFAIETDTPRGASYFLRAAEQVLGKGHVLAVTPQGRFTDARERPVHLRSGLAALIRQRARRGQNTTVIPLALEYTFWDQRLPEALVNCGELLHFPAVDGGTRHDNVTQPDVHAALEAAMSRAQDELATLSLQRSAQPFHTVLEGKRGSAGFYGVLEAVRAWTGKAAPAGDHRAHTRQR